MSKYTETKLEYERLGDTRLYSVTSPITWAVGYKDSGLTVEVPKGFTFDITVNWFTKLFVSPHDPEVLKAAALHDYLLTDGWNRVSAGAEFHQALKADKVPFVKRLVMWFAVSIWKID